MSNSVRPHRRQPTRLLHPWDSPGQNTGVGCHFLLQFMKVKSESEVAQSCLSLRNSMDCSLPGCSVHQISQARVLEWVAIAFSRINMTRTLKEKKNISHKHIRKCLSIIIFIQHSTEYSAIKQRNGVTDKAKENTRKLEVRQ